MPCVRHFSAPLPSPPTTLASICVASSPCQPLSTLASPLLTLTQYKKHSKFQFPRISSTPASSIPPSSLILPSSSSHNPRHSHHFRSHPLPFSSLPLALIIPRCSHPFLAFSSARLIPFPECSYYFQSYPLSFSSPPLALTTPRSSHHFPAFSSPRLIPFPAFSTP